MSDGKKCVIIGSGLGGLSTGVILARHGYRVTVLEQGRRIGGCLQCFERRGVRFETGMHFIGSALPGQTLYRLMRYLGIADIPLSPLDTTGYDIIRLGDSEFRYANGTDAFVDTLATQFPAERDNLHRYMEIVGQVAAMSSLHTLDPEAHEFNLDSHYHTVNVNSVVDSLFDDPLLRQVIVGNIPLYAGQRDMTPFAQHAFIHDFYNSSAFRVVGGSDCIADRLADIIRANDGEVRADSRVTAIRCNDELATSVVVNDSEAVDADIIISDIHPARLMQLLDTRLLRPAFRQRMMSLPNTPSCFTVYIKFKPGTIPYMASNYYSYRTSPWDYHSTVDEAWPANYLYMHGCTEPDQRYATTATLLAFMDIGELAPWLDTTSGRRGADYEAYKERMARRLIDRLGQDFPDTPGAIEAYYTSTPLTYRDYTGTVDGSIYGVARDITLGPAGRVPYRTRIPNLLLTGQNTNSHGILGVIAGSIVTAAGLLTPRTVYDSILASNE